MKILLISNMYPKDTNDTFGIFIKNIEDGLKQGGADVKKIVIEGRGNNLLSKLKKYIIFYTSILKVNFDDYDIIHLSYPSHTYFPLFLKSFKKAKLVVRLHGHDLIPISFFQKILLFFTKKSIKKAEMVIVPSNYFYNELTKIIKPKDYFIYPSGGLDINNFYPIKNTIKEKFTLGYVGRIDKGKGVDILLKAVSKLTFDFRLIIVGGGDLLEEMKELSSKINKTQDIIFIGKTPNNKLVEYYNKFDLFIFPTLMQESFGNVAIEAMGCKVPIIGSNIGALPDYIFDDINGYLFNAGNSEELANLINNFYYLSSEKKLEMSKEAYSISLRYEKKIMSKNFIDKLYKMEQKS